MSAQRRTHPMIDLNDLVQERLAALDRVLVESSPGDDLANAFRYFPSVALTLIVSWRERWDRHGPARSTPPYHPVNGLPWCARCAEWGCTDALAILREIGVKV